MADNIDISAIVRVVDQASPALQNIQKAIGQIGDGAKTVGTTLRDFAQGGWFGGIESNLRNVGGEFSKIGGQIRTAFAPILALAGVAGIGGTVKALQNYVQTAHEVSRASRRLGVDAETLQIFRFAAGGPERADMALTRLQRTMVGVVQGTKASEKAAEALSRFGVSQEEIEAHDIGALLPKIFEGFRQTTDPVQRASDAMALFSVRTGQMMIPFLIQGAAGLETAGQKLRELGIISNEQAAQAGETALAQKELNFAFDGVKNAIAGELLPVWKDFLVAVKDFLVTNREDIAAGFKALGEALKGIDWKGLLTNLQSVMRELNRFVKLLGGWEVVIPALVLVLNPLGAALIKLGLAVLTATGPWGVLAVAAVAAVLLIMRYWTPITRFFANLWAGIKAIFWDAIASIREAARAFAAGFLQDAIAPVLRQVARLPGAVGRKAQEALASIEEFAQPPAETESQWSQFLERIKREAEEVEPPDITPPPNAEVEWTHIADELQTAMQQIRPPAALADLRMPTDLELSDEAEDSWESLDAAIKQVSKTVADAPAKTRRAGKQVGDAAKQAKDTIDALNLEPPAGTEAAWSSLAESIKESWSGLSGYFGDLWGAIIGIFERARDSIISIVAQINAAVAPLAGMAQGVQGTIATGVTTPFATAAPPPRLLEQQGGVREATTQRSEIDQRLRVDLSPELRATLQSQRTTGAPVSTQVDVGHSMEPAMGVA